MAGMFDDLIAQVQGTPQPAAATDVPQESPVDSAGRAMGNAVTMGAAPYMGGAVNYAMEGGAPGSFDQGYQQSVGASENSQAQNPNAYTGGTMAGMALDSVIPGTLLAKGVARGGAMTGAALRYGLRAMGLGNRFTDAAIEHGPALVRAVRNGRGAAQTEEATALGDALLARAQGRPSGYQGSGDPFRGPAPNARMNELSPEMQAQSDAYQAFLRRHGR